MKLLIKKVTVVDPGSSHDGKEVDLLIDGGKVAEIGAIGEKKGAKVFDATGLFLSPGWLDIGAQGGDPGFEHREDAKSLAAAAARGGFTGLALYPNTEPTVHSKSEVRYVRRSAEGLLVDFFPIGAISQHTQGREITEMMDMIAAGAVAFSDGKKSVQHSGLMLRALLYVKAFNGLIINHPSEFTLATNGQMHEGFTSTSLGLQGIPAIAEELMVQRDIDLLAYTDSCLHLANISSTRSVALIRAAKSRGLSLTASVPALNLLFRDSDLGNFDTNFKVLPPLREEEDIEQLKAGLADGTIDVITSNHFPLEEERKKLEFPYADFGATGLESAFAVANTALEGTLSVKQLIEKLAINPRKILGLPVIAVETGGPANFTLFDPEESWTFSSADIYSRSVNTPLIGKELKGRVKGVVNSGQWDFFKHL